MSAVVSATPPLSSRAAWAGTARWSGWIAARRSWTMAGRMPLSRACRMFRSSMAMRCFTPSSLSMILCFGTMFFANPVAGLRNMRKALKPGGIMTHIVWRTRNDNPWLSMAKDVVLKFLPPPGEDALTCGPGPFSMADEATVSKMMGIAVCSDISVKRVDAPVLVGRTVEDAVNFQLAIGPAGEVFREAGKEAEAKRDQIEAALAEAINFQKKDADGIVMDSSSW